MDRFESTPDTSLPARRPAATQARTQGPRDSASRRAAGAGPEKTPGHDKAQGENNSPSPREVTVPPAAPRAKLTVSEFNLLRWYARTRFEDRLDRREEFEKAYPAAVGMRDLLDVADIVLEVTNELAAKRAQMKREDAKVAAKRRMARRKVAGR